MLLDHLNSQQSVVAASSALSPETWLFSLEWLPEAACLVGGTVRDALLGRTSEYLDLDFVLPIAAVETAQAIARHYKAGFVLLDGERQIARVVFPQGTADFAQQVGSSLAADLERRDFTVNAIAYNPHTDQILDPLRGYADLQKRLLRMISPENLREDPLRLLRAYRQAAQLGFTVAAETRSTICQLAPLLKQIAAERVQSELNYLLNTAKGTPWLAAAWQDGLLSDWFPSATATSLVQVEAIDQTTAMLEETLPALVRELHSPLRHTFRSGSTKSGLKESWETEAKTCGSTRTWLTAAKLASLLPIDPAMAEIQLRRLKYSRNEVQAVSTVLKFLPQLCDAVKPAESAGESATIALSLRSQCQFFQAVGLAFPAIALLAIVLGVPFGAIAPLLRRYLTPTDPVAHPTPLLTGQDLMTALLLLPGPHIGRLLAEIQLARAEEKISTAAEAIQFAAALL